MVLYGLVDLGMNSWDFYLGFCYKKFQTTNTSVVKLFWVKSMLVLRNGCKKENVGFFKGKPVKNLVKPKFLFWL